VAANVFACGTRDQMSVTRCNAQQHA
jgi:hypothetical protein